VRFCPFQVNERKLTGLIQDQTSLAGLQALLKQHKKLVNVIHINAALKWLARHPQQQPRSSEQLAAVVQQLVKGLALEQPPARNCASIAYYCSKLGYVEDLGLYRALLQRFMVVKEGADPQAISNLLYALGSQPKLQGLLDVHDLVELLQQLQQVAAGTPPQAISNALWAAAKCEPGDSPQLGQVVAQLLRRFVGSLGDAEPQGVSNTLHALALLPRAWPMDSALQLVEQLVQVLPQAQPQHVSSALWALGQYVVRGWLAPLYAQPCAPLQAAVTEFAGALAASSQVVKPVEASNGLWGMAMLQAQVHRRVVAQLLGCVVQEQQDAQALVRACWAVAKLQLDPALVGTQQPWWSPFRSAAQACVPLLPRATPQQVADMLWACAMVRHYPQQLLQAITQGSAPLRQVQQANAEEVADLAWALAVLAPDPPPTALLASLLGRMQDLLAQQPAAVNNQALANTAWAVAVLDQQQLAAQLVPLAAAAFSQQRWSSSQVEDLTQWHQVHLWLTDTKGPSGLGGLAGVSQQQLQQCRETWEQGMACDAEASLVHAEVAKVRAGCTGNKHGESTHLLPVTVTCCWHEHQQSPKSYSVLV
jgi:hypothetical protein